MHLGLIPSGTHVPKAHTPSALNMAHGPVRRTTTEEWVMSIYMYSKTVWMDGQKNICIFCDEYVY